MSSLTHSTRLVLLLSTWATLFVSTQAASQFDQRIVGGENAPSNSAPYQISLQTLPGDHMCGGAIVAEQWIVTAGHCVAGWPADRLRVAVGSNRYNEPGAVYYPDAVYVHCNYNEPRYHNDIALLHLNQSISYNEQTRAIALAPQPALEGERLRFTGWGTLTLWGEVPEQLQQLDVQLVPRAQCALLLQSFDDVVVDRGHICAFAQLEQGACHGDSGGPLVNANEELLGILNWYSPCAQGVPDMYISVRFYTDWLRQVMSGNRKCNNHVLDVV